MIDTSRSSNGPSTSRRSDAAQLSVLVIGIALVTWVVAIHQMRGMDAGPGTDLGTLGWYVGVWVTMMAAMMLPPALPMVLLFDRVGRARAAGVGLGHGSYCVGCCVGLMLVLFALGVMSLFWMAVVAALIFAEKVLPIGARLPRAFAPLFVALGLWVALALGSVPGLTQPHGMLMPPR